MRTEDASLGHGRRVFHEADYVATTTTPGITTFVQGSTTQFANRLDTLLTLVKATGAIPVCVSQPHRFVVEQAGRRVGVRNVVKVQGRALNGLDFDMSLRALAAALQSRCEKAGGYFMDIGARPFEAGDFYDGVHMTPSGARRLGGYMFEAMKGTSLMAALTHPPIRLAPSDRATVP